MATENEKAIALIGRVEQFYQDLYIASTLGITVYGITMLEQYNSLLEAAGEVANGTPPLPQAPGYEPNRPREQTATIMMLAGQLAQWLRGTTNNHQSVYFAGDHAGPPRH